MKHTIDTVAEALDIGPQTLRVLLQKGMVTFGMAFKNDGCKNYKYILYPQKVREYIGDMEKGNEA